MALPRYFQFFFFSLSHGFNVRVVIFCRLRDQEIATKKKKHSKSRSYKCFTTMLGLSPHQLWLGIGLKGCCTWGFIVLHQVSQGAGWDRRYYLQASSPPGLPSLIKDYSVKNWDERVNLWLDDELGLLIDLMFVEMRRHVVSHGMGCHGVHRRWDARHRKCPTFGLVSSS